MKHMLSCRKAFAWWLYVASSFISGEMEENYNVTLYRTSFCENRFPFKEIESFGDMFWFRWLKVIGVRTGKII